MKGAIISSQGGEAHVVDDLEKPRVGPGQVLVKSLWLAINPVDTFLSQTGFLVEGWPLVLGVDASGVIVEASSEATEKYGLKEGDYICGCTRLGSPGYAAGQEYHLFDAQTAFPKPKNLSLAQAATLGVGAETACLSLYDGLHLELPDPTSNTSPEPKDEWIVIFGGAGSVGKSAIQLARAGGYQVVATVSSRSADVVKSLGASTCDYKKSIEEQVKSIMETTGGKFKRIFDSTSSEDPVLARELFKAAGFSDTSGGAYFASTNDWTPIKFPGVAVYGAMLGPVGRPNQPDLNNSIAKFIPVVVGLTESGILKPSEYEVIGEGGFEDIVKAFKYQVSGAAGSNKVVVKVQDE